MRCKAEQARLRCVASALFGLACAAVLALAHPARADGEQSKPVGISATNNPHAADLVALRDYAQQIGVQGLQVASIVGSNNPHAHSDNAEIVALREYAEQIGAADPASATVEDSQSPHSQPADDVFAELRDYAQQIGIVQPSSSAPLRMAQADNAFDALRDFLNRGSQPDPTPAPNAAPGSTPKAKSPAAPRRARPPVAPVYVAPVLVGHLVGSKTCLGCHAAQTAAFGNTLMGRIAKTQPGKFECENCHGPGSEHVKAIGCAACHGEGGVTRRPGTPSLIGQDPQYLVPAMKAYVTGQRKHELMRSVLAGAGDAEFRSIASYYASQVAERAPTPLVGNPSAGRGAIGVCAGCHGEHGISIVPAWPNLAGQDAQYLADAIRAYKRGSRTKAIACAACHGAGGVSRSAGMPSLVGQDPQYLVLAMKAYVDGERKHGLMTALLTGVSDSELDNMADYYAGQTPARAQTSLVGDPAAGKSSATACVECHGTGHGAADPAWPSLAGQDAQYLAHAIRTYKEGSRDKVVACAACHGAGGISKRPGMPNLVGLDPQYLESAMKAYVSGQREGAVMKALLAGVSDAELNNMAQYYAGHAAARAQTPIIGDPSAGKTASTACAGCHGEQGVSSNPAWPSLAGQDARYLTNAIRAYKDGSRDKVVACAACHGAGGISKQSGVPSLVGLDPQYLVSAMKAYVSGERKSAVMKALLAGVSDAELNNMVQYYARHAAARAQTPIVGDPSAGKTASAACAGCHGEQGVSSNPAWPSLAGQDARYLADALKAYKNGSRTDATMKGLAASLDDRTINDIASYYAGLAPAQPSATGAPSKADPVLVSNRIVASLDDRTINDIASYYAGLAPAQPSATGTASRSDPVLVSNHLVASLDGRTIDDVASYFASLQPEQAAGAPSATGMRDPVLVRNSLLAGLGEATINNIASYYATQRPEQPGGGRGVAGGPPPIRVGGAAPADGSSVGGIISFRKDDPSRRVEDNNAICLNCHERGERTFWRGSVHEERAVACTNCHTIMKNVSAVNQLKTPWEPNTCFQCHKDRQAQLFRSSHMPMREGKITCSNCHNPHGSPTEGLLREASINDNCYKCHAEKRGPFLFEHAPVRENCLNCHDPHGSINEFSLKMSRPRLCYECHTIGHGQAGVGSQFTMSRSCQNCHTLIHGSNSPAGAVFQR